MADELVVMESTILYFLSKLGHAQSYLLLKQKTQVPQAIFSLASFDVFEATLLFRTELRKNKTDGT